ncbi:hypothetical protein HIM_12572 [Hirsutella minnesotensis 3608]|uniref:Uncharacterized protein n=1 Tax=Hirsutella minnesotensis 3608 TaxID=1043627 RepID=A0A0F7ZZY2_9HYPO|nr:hypothetical protein HIM_12572 [Hirsutella minnesotensis 3608]
MARRKRRVSASDKSRCRIAKGHASTSARDHIVTFVTEQCHTWPTIGSQSILAHNSTPLWQFHGSQEASTVQPGMSLDPALFNGLLGMDPYIYDIPKMPLAAQTSSASTDEFQWIDPSFACNTYNVMSYFKDELLSMQMPTFDDSRPRDLTWQSTELAWQGNGEPMDDQNSGLAPKGQTNSAVQRLVQMEQQLRSQTRQQLRFAAKRL